MQTYLDTQQDLPALLEEAARAGAVRIRRENGQTFLLTPDTLTGHVAAPSPLDIPGVNLSVSAEEIVAVVRAGRERG